MKSIKILGNFLCKLFSTFKGKFFQKGDLQFNVSFAICLIISCLIFLNPKAVKVFFDLGVILGLFLTLITIFGVAVFLTFATIIGFLSIKFLIEEIKETIAKKEYLMLIAIAFGTTLFILMIRPFLELFGKLFYFYLLK
ncbi:hypothetical protein [Flavobacterium wongokense]|uniref:hypothetical protein n=1 Tax=Flavobacterium wongokense TaxID=2910674 RepID=UPI001F322733|nr:hypothetical protein [Flavobacterium sp. WG47]MCF6131110.1 hypothetical protein [Flavobacterium sp. WG47]